MRWYNWSICSGVKSRHTLQNIWWIRFIWLNRRICSAVKMLLVEEVEEILIRVTSRATNGCNEANDKDDDGDDDKLLRMMDSIQFAMALYTV